MLKLLPTVKPKQLSERYYDGELMMVLVNLAQPLKQKLFTKRYIRRVCAWHRDPISASAITNSCLAMLDLPVSHFASSGWKCGVVLICYWESSCLWLKYGKELGAFLFVTPGGHLGSNATVLSRIKQCFVFE